MFGRKISDYSHRLNGTFAKLGKVPLIKHHVVSKFHDVMDAWVAFLNALDPPLAVPEFTEQFWQVWVLSNPTFWIKAVVPVIRPAPIVPATEKRSETV